MTVHNIYTDNKTLYNILDNSIQLVVTSPPYPMIQMWDEVFAKSNANIHTALEDSNDAIAFELMHRELDKVWQELYRILNVGCFVCINIGDASRTFKERFQIYSNHVRIIMAFQKLGFDILPLIIWRKPTNSPTKFMGSGMLPAGAYVTMEHEYILIFRKKGKRFKTTADKHNRCKSSFFWEERNQWFSDCWNIKGASQKQRNVSRSCGAVFPMEIPHRLINMFSVKGDTVLDPFVGTGTTMLAAALNERNSIGFEIEDCFHPIIINKLKESQVLSHDMCQKRVKNHVVFIHEYSINHTIKHTNITYDLPVISAQEKLLSLSCIDNIFIDKYTININHKPFVYNK